MGLTDFILFADVIVSAGVIFSLKDTLQVTILVKISQISY
jgi:hypothetical protein